MKLAYEFDPFELAGVDRPKGSKLSEAQRAIAEYVLDEVIATVGDGKSPVAGGRWKRSLSAEYKAAKVKAGGNSYADMILDGDMLKALKARPSSNGRVSLSISGREGDKADGHNNFSGRSELPAREFIPKDGQTFNRKIMAGIREIARQFLEDDDG